MNNLDIEMLLKVLNGSAKMFREFGCDVGETIALNNYIVNLQKQIKELKSDLEYVMEQTYGALTQNWCIDWNFTDIREKYNISNKLGSDKE